MKSIIYASEPWFPSKEDTFTVFAAITHDCNKQCLHCFAAENIKQTTLEDKEWFALLDQLAELKNPRLFFTGGEPLQHPSLLSFISYASKKMIPVILGTNATLITPIIAKDLSIAGVSEARVSIDGANAITNDLMRGIGSFDEARRGILSMIEAGISVSIRTTVNKNNFHEMEDLCKLVYDLGVKDWEIKHIIPAGRALEHPELLTTSGERDEALNTILRIVNTGMFPHLKIKLMEGTINRDAIIPKMVKVASCPAGSRMMVVQPTGNVIPCGYLTTDAIGNITESSLQTIRDMWEEKRKKSEKFSLPEGCKNCKHAYTCKGGCPVFNFCEEDVCYV